MEGGEKMNDSKKVVECVSVEKYANEIINESISNSQIN